MLHTMLVGFVIAVLMFALMACMMRPMELFEEFINSLEESTQWKIMRYFAAGAIMLIIVSDHYNANHKHEKAAATPKQMTPATPSHRQVSMSMPMSCTDKK